MILLQTNNLFSTNIIKSSQEKYRGGSQGINAYQHSSGTVTWHNGIATHILNDRADVYSTANTGSDAFFSTKSKAEQWNVTDTATMQERRMKYVEKPHDNSNQSSHHYG